jgi:hypothetical protein
MIKVRSSVGVGKSKMKLIDALDILRKKRHSVSLDFGGNDYWVDGNLMTVEEIMRMAQEYVGASELAEKARAVITDENGVNLNSSANRVFPEDKARLAVMLNDFGNNASSGTTARERLNEFIDEVEGQLLPEELEAVQFNGTLFFDLNAELPPQMINTFNEITLVNWSDDAGIAVPVVVSAKALIDNDGFKYASTSIPRGAQYYVLDPFNSYAQAMGLNDTAAQVAGATLWLDDAWDEGEDDTILDVPDSERTRIMNWTNG